MIKLVTLGNGNVINVEHVCLVSKWEAEMVNGHHEHLMGDDRKKVVFAMNGLAEERAEKNELLRGILAQLVPVTPSTMHGAILQAEAQSIP